jgi:hypothetical protein
MFLLQLQVAKFLLEEGEKLLAVWNSESRAKGQKEDGGKSKGHKVKATKPKSREKTDPQSAHGHHKSLDHPHHEGHEGHPAHDQGRFQGQTQQGHSQGHSSNLSWMFGKRSVRSILHDLVVRKRHQVKYFQFTF